MGLRTLHLQSFSSIGSYLPSTCRIWRFYPDAVGFLCNTLERDSASYPTLNNVEILIPVYRPDMKFQADAVILHGQQFDCHIRVSSGFDFSKVRIWSGFEVSKGKITGELQFTPSHARFFNGRIPVDSEPELAWIRSWSDWPICILIITKYEVVLNNLLYNYKFIEKT